MKSENKAVFVTLLVIVVIAVWATGVTWSWRACNNGNRSACVVLGGCFSGGGGR